MDKIKLSKKQVKEACLKNELIKVGYCELQNLLYNVPAFGYSVGVYGWACDYYRLGNRLTVCTGYQPTGEEIPQNIIDKWEKLAHEARHGGGYDMLDRLETLQIGFCADVQNYFRSLKN